MTQALLTRQELLELLPYLTPQERVELDEILAASDPLVYSDPVSFLLDHLYITETESPITLVKEQRDVITAMFERNEIGQFRYSTIVYSSIKKSAKTTIGGGLALWQGWRIPNGYIYIVGNDLNQADNRMMEAIRYAVLHNPQMQGRVRVIRNTIHLDNGTTIEAVPVEAAGEAGGNPTGIFWTELWGAKQKKHEEMWSEMALSPTRQGESFKFVESYAGHSGESLILERLYNAIVQPENVLNPDISPELYATGRSIAYWNTRRYLPWQIENADYYAQEAIEKTPSEYARQHENKWATSENKFVPDEWWTVCQAESPPLRHNQAVVIGLDAATTNDCFGIVMVSRDGETVDVRAVRKWIPPKGGKLEFSDPLNPNNPDTPEGYLRGLITTHNTVCIVYDEYQLHDLCSRLMREMGRWFEAFGQGQPRLVSDKQLYDLIQAKQIRHNGNADLTEHVGNSNAKDRDGSGLRIVKRVADKKIDLCVALSMAAYQAKFLNIGQLPG